MQDFLLMLAQTDGDLGRGGERSAIGLYWMSLERFLQASITRFMNLGHVNFNTVFFSVLTLLYLLWSRWHIYTSSENLVGCSSNSVWHCTSKGRNLLGLPQYIKVFEYRYTKCFSLETSSLVRSCKFSAGWCLCKMKSMNNSWIFHHVFLHWSEMVIWVPDCRDLAKRVGHSEDKDRKKHFWQDFSLPVLVCRQVA